MAMASERSFTRILPAGSALVDTGAGHPTCGSLSFERIEIALNQCGIKSVVIPAHMASIPACANGVGGVASTKEVRVVPMRFGNDTIFAEMLILDNDVPPLLPATLLDSCIVDLQRNVIVWNWANKKQCETEMLILKSKHRSIDITNFSEVVFSVPQGVLSKYGVFAFDFIYQAASPVAGN